MVERWSYTELTDRNWGFLAPEIQERVRSTRVFLAGCGLGSNIAVLAARTGFSRFILADGDSVEINNLNRQAFHLNHTGQNKAASTAALVREINPEAEIETFPQYITENEVCSLVSRADIIVNMVDPGPALLDINRVARSQNKLVFFPFNVGFGGITLAFSPDSPTLEEMTGGEVSGPDLFLRLAAAVGCHIPYLTSYMAMFTGTQEEIFQGQRPGPQLGIAASINASLIVTAIIRVLSGLSINTAPVPLALDAWNCHNSSGRYN